MFVVLFWVFVGHTFVNLATDDLNDVMLVNTPKNNSHLHYVKNDTNETSSILLFTQNISLPQIPSGKDYQYFLCFQLWRQNETDSILTNETELKCYKQIPDYPFNISNLTNGIYYIKTSLLLASQSNVNDIIILKKETIIFNVKEMIDFHASYDWKQIKDYHAVIKGLDVKMDIGGNGTNRSNNTNVKLVKIPNQWLLQLFISSQYRLLWLMVSKSTTLSRIKYEISKHTGIDYSCIEIMDNDGVILNNFETIESVDWFYNKYSIFIGLDPSLFCQPLQCGFGYRQNENLDQCDICDYKTIEYKQFYRDNKGKMEIDLTNPKDFLMTLPPNS